MNALIFGPAGMSMSTLAEMSSSLKHSSVLSNRLSILNLELKLHTDSTSLITRGQLYALSGKYKEAIEDFKSALQHDETNHEAHFYLGFMQDVEGDYEQATESYTKALEKMKAEKEKKTPRNDLASAVNSLSKKFNIKKSPRGEDRDSDRIFFESLTKFKVEKHHVLNNRAIAHMHNRQYSRGVSDMNLAVAMSSKDRDLYLFNMAIAYLYSHDYTNAISFFTQAIETYSECHMVVECHSYFLFRATAYELAGESEKGKKDRLEATYMKENLNTNPLRYELLPDNALDHILSFLDFKTVAISLRLTNRYWNRAIVKNRNIWNHLYITYAMTTNELVLKSYISYVQQHVIDAQGIIFEQVDDAVLTLLPQLFENRILRFCKFYNVTQELVPKILIAIQPFQALKSLFLHFVSGTIDIQLSLPAEITQLSLLKQDLTFKKLVSILEPCGGHLQHLMLDSGKLLMTSENLVELNKLCPNVTKIVLTKKCVTQNTLELIKNDVKYSVHGIMNTKTLYNDVDLRGILQME